MIFRSVIFNFFFIFGTFLYAIICLPLLITPRGAMRVSRNWGRAFLFLLRVICNIRHEIRGVEYIPTTACIIASKHQSAWDTLIFLALLNHPSYVLKKELTWLPLYGLYLIRMGCIAVDRGAGADALKSMLRRAATQISRGAQVIIYPEGTRTKPGENVTYHPGVAALYSHLRVPVVPVALNSGYLWPKNSFLKKPGVVSIEFLPPIQPGLKSRDFLTTLKTEIEKTVENLPPRPHGEVY